MIEPKQIQHFINTLKYLQLNLRQVKTWTMHHDPCDLPLPDRMSLEDLEESDLLFDPDGQDDVLLKTEAAAFHAGLALREAGLEYEDLLATTANFVVLRAKLSGISLDNLDDVEFTIDKTNNPPLINLSGPGGSVSASIVTRIDSMYEPWDGAFNRSELDES